MGTCGICGEEIPAGSRTCSVCGSTADDMMMPAPALMSPAADVTYTPMELQPGETYCPVCVQVYGVEYTDPFCSCGTELLREIPGAPPMAPFLDDVPMAPILDDAPPLHEVDFSLETTSEFLAPPAYDPAAGMKVRQGKPRPGTPCLVLYGPDRQPLQFFALTKDTMLIGRLDAVAGNFPDIDLDEWFDRATIRKISRQHALILRSRATKTFALRPLVGNTGTQLDGDMIAPQQDYPLQPGQRIILGGVIRLKFETAT